MYLFPIKIEENDVRYNDKHKEELEVQIHEKKERGMMLNSHLWRRDDLKL